MASLPGDYGLELRAPSSESVLSSRIQADIILVHGINGDPKKTWVHQDGDGQRDWTSDVGFLPSMMPLCRIYTFKWNASITHYNSDADIKNIASGLLWHIDQVRRTQEEKHRKLLFIGHSLGGLLIQRALTLDSRVQGRRLIQESTVGIIFLGTPHGGSGLANVFKRVLFFADSPKPLFDVLSIGSLSLNKITTRFIEYATTRLADCSQQDLEIVSFGEMLRTTRLGIFQSMVVPLDRARLGLSNELFEQALGKNHQTIARFKSPSDALFLRIVSHLRRFIDKPVPSVPHHPPVQRDQIFEIPPMTERFEGREGELAKLHAFLSGSAAEKHVSVYGQRGMGKSELVLRYLSKHRHEYDTVKWFDASSEDILRTQMESFYEFLSQGEDPSLKEIPVNDSDQNRCETVLRWFQKEQNCIIVYDNYDVNNDFDLGVFIPHHSPAHRIIIGPAAHKCELSNFDLEVGQMTGPDATRMFTCLAGIRDEEILEVDQAIIDQITDQLDRTPFYLSFGARHLRDTECGLLQMLEHIHEQKRDTRLKSSQLVTGDGSVIWSIAYGRIKQREPSFTLLNLFAFLHGFDIRSLLLQRFWTDRIRWNEHGERETRSARDDGIPCDLTNLFKNKDAFEEALKPLLDATFLGRRRTGSNTRIEMRPLVQQYVIRELSQEEQLRWMKTVIRLVSHAIPEESCLEDKNFEVNWSVIITHIFKCVQTLLAMGTPVSELSDIHEPLVFMLLCSVGRSDKDRGLLRYIDSLLRYQSDVWQRCRAAKWRGYFEFNDGNRDKAEELLGKTQDKEMARVLADPTLKTARNNAAIGDVILHRAQCLFSQRSYYRVMQVIESWHPISPESRLEARMHGFLQAAACKNQIFLERYDEAMRGLQEILAPADPAGPLAALDEFNWATITLGQLYCKRRQYDAAVELVNPRVKRFLDEDRRLEPITSDFRLILCEALLQTHKYDAFDKHLKSLERDLLLPGQKGKPRSPKLLRAARTLRARSYYTRGRWPQALDAWRRLLVSDGVQEDDILREGHMTTRLQDATDAYGVSEAVLSMAVTYWRVDDAERAMAYWDVITVHPASMDYPSEEIDYSGWLGYVKAEFEEQKANKYKKRKRRAWFASPRKGSVGEAKNGDSAVITGLEEPVQDDGYHGDNSKRRVFADLEVDFTEVGMAGAAQRYASCPDCEHCHCDLK
ncbi:hypothetical protein B0H66DRAFT_394025 [Apodospora peruviana]|uniref:DUF676 domain-containing protein n=1 Tax=Apodospora peruviana TaxID=516989 RepID=A0AAE0HU86_9PEZI|nr:hypothetical protein B0H66DRAFT_394025 [Apodospora peruviana]